MADTFATARWLVHDRGFSVLPLEPRGKRPTAKWTAFQQARPTADNLLAWFGNGAQRNLGIVTGAISNIVVVDCDSPEAIAWADARLPTSPMITRTAKGEHRFFRHPGTPVKNAARLKTDSGRLAIDVRGDGGYVVGPTSVHPCGAIYEAVGAWPLVDELPVFDPAWLEVAILAPFAAGATSSPDSYATDRRALIRRARAYLAATPPAVEGVGGDGHTFQVCCRLIRGFNLGDAETFELLSEWNQRCIPPWTDAKLIEKIDGARKYGTEPIGGRLNVSADVTKPPSEPTRVRTKELGPFHTLILNPRDPLPSARTFTDRHHLVEGVLALRHHGGVFYAYDLASNAYLGRDEAAIRAQVYTFVEGAQRWSEPKGGQSSTLVPFQPTKSKVENILDALRALCNLPTSYAAPCWLEANPGLDPLNILPCRNGLLHIPTRELLPATPQFFTLNGLDFSYDQHATEPERWLRFLRVLWPDDQESQDTLQELFGYFLTPRTHFQKIAMLVGPKRSGKGTIGRVLRRLLGDQNVCGPTLSNMAEQFGLSILISRAVAIIADARISGRSDTAVVAERLLSISGEDTLSIPRKYLPDWTGKLSTRFLIMTNELPRIEDASGALASRFVVLTLQESFYGREDHGLLDSLITELPGILNWALQGYDRLYARARFLQPATSAALIQEFEDLGSPVGAFLRERCIVDKGEEESTDSLFNAWTDWCGENGRDRPGTSATLGRNLRAAIPWLYITQHRHDGIRGRYYNGLRLRQSYE